MDAASIPVISILTDIVQERRPISELHRCVAPLREVVNIFCRVRELINPWVFYHRVRRFLKGWKEITIGGSLYSFVGGSAA